METVQVERDGATLKLTEAELIILANAINEALEALPDWEFSTRIGATPGEATALRERIGAIISSMAQLDTQAPPASKE
jgi:hypothetical protein